MQLLMELFLDECVDVLVAELLRQRGFDVQTTEEVGRKGEKDPQQLEYAVAHGRVMVTHNRVHFLNLDKAWRAEGKMHLGIILASQQNPHQMADRLEKLMNNLTAEDIRGSIQYV